MGATQSTEPQPRPPVTRLPRRPPRNPPRNPPRGPPRGPSGRSKPSGRRRRRIKTNQQVRTITYENENDGFYRPKYNSERLPSQSTTRRRDTQYNSPDSQIVIQEPDYSHPDQFQPGRYERPSISEDISGRDPPIVTRESDYTEPVPMRYQRARISERKSRDLLTIRSGAVDPQIVIQEPDYTDPDQFQPGRGESEEAYRILGVDRNASFDVIKGAYREQARRVHPDKGGSAELFNILKRAYHKLKRKHEESMDYKVDKPVRKRDYTNIVPETDGYQNRHLDKDNFSVDHFNELYDEARMTSVDDQGYGHMMEDGVVEDFDDDQIYDIMEYEEPDAYISSATSLNYDELGKESMDDFSGGTQGGTQYMDYKRAYHQKVKFIDPEKVHYKDRTINQIKSERSRAIGDLSLKDREILRLRQERDDEREELRQLRWKEQRYREDKHFTQHNTKLLTRGGELTRGGRGRGRGRQLALRRN